MWPHPQQCTHVLSGPTFMNGLTRYHTPAALIPSLTSLRATMSPITTMTTDDAEISPWCVLSLMLWWFASYCTWMGITTPPSSTWISSRICCRPSVHLLMFLMRGTSWTFSLSQVSFSSISITPLSTICAVLIMTSLYASAIAAVVCWWVIAMIALFTFLYVFIIWMWAGAFRWESALLIADAISWSIMFGRGTSLSLLTIRRPSAMLDPDSGSGPGPADALCLWFRGCTQSHLLAGVDLGSGLGSCCWLDCCLSRSLGLGLGCCCIWCFSGLPRCIAPACCEASRPLPSCLAVSFVSTFVTSQVSTASPTWAFASTFPVMFTMLAPYSTLSLWRLSHFVSLTSGHSFMLRHCTSSRATCAFKILAILSIGLCSWVTSHTCCLTIRSIRLLLCPGALTRSKVLFLRFVLFLLPSHCLLVAMKNTRDVSLNLGPAALLASAASAMCTSLSITGFFIVPIIWLFTSSVAIVTGLLDVVSHRSHSDSIDSPGGLVMLVSGHFDARNGMLMLICHSLSWLLSCFEVSVFWYLPRPFANPLNCVHSNGHNLH